MSVHKKAMRSFFFFFLISNGRLYIKEEHSLVHRKCTRAMRSYGFKIEIWVLKMLF